MSAVTVRSTTGTAPITITAEGAGVVRIDLEDGTTQVYDAAVLREAVKAVTASPIGMATVLRLYAKHDITDPSQAKRLARERFTQDELDEYQHALALLDGSGAIG